MIFVDFETRSACDLKKCGVDIYAKHPSTEILCMGFAFDDEPVEIWTPKRQDPLDVFLACAVEPSVDGGSTAQPIFIAHNAPFEIAIWNGVGVEKYGFPPIVPEQFMCTMAMAYAMALPGSLDGASAAVGIKDGKDMAGHRLMMQLSQPRDEIDGKVTWWEDEVKFERLYNYCAKDVAVERELYKRLVKLSESERKVWLLDQKINSRGVTIDRKAVSAAIRLVKNEKDRCDTDMRRVTNGAVASCNATAQLTNWLRFRGVDTEGVAKTDVSELLEGASLPEECRVALLLRQEAAKSSTAKLEMMVKGAGEDGRIRGLTAYHGASTGRFAGRRIQVHNLPRSKIPQEFIENIFGILERVQ